MIPVAIRAIVLGPTGGAIAGADLWTDKLWAVPWNRRSQRNGSNAALVSIHVLAFIQRCSSTSFGWFACLGFIYKATRKRTNAYVACAVTGFFSAFLNTLFFMTFLVVLFGNTEYVQGLMNGRNVIIGCCMMVGVNAISEMVASTVITGAIGAALSKARLLRLGEIVLLALLVTVTVNSNLLALEK